MSLSVFQRYLHATASSGAAKVFQVFAAIGVVWLLNAILGKEEFGLFMIVFALYYILAEGVANLFQSLILYHEASDDDVHSTPKIAGTCLTYGFILGSLLAFGLYALSAPLAGWMDKPEALLWFQYLGSFIPFQVLMILLGSLYRARQRVPTMIFFQEFLPSFVRFTGLGVMWTLGIDPFHIVSIYILSYLIPFAILYAQAPLMPRFDVRVFTLWDVRYALQSMVSQVVNKSSRNIIIVVLGVVGSAALTAEYTIASRIAQLLNLPKQAIAQLQVPRFRNFLKNKDLHSLKNEYDTARIVMFLATLFGVLGILVLGETLLGAFGDYAIATPILMVLAIGSLIHAAFGIVGGYIIMAGYAGWGLFWNSVSLIVLCIATTLFVPVMGGVGAAWAMVLSIFAGLAGMVFVIRQKDALNLVPSEFWMWMGATITLIAAVSFNITSVITALMGLAGILMFSLFRHRDRLFSFLQNRGMPS